MKDFTTRAMRVKENGCPAVVFINHGNIELEIMDENEFIRYACASHLEEYGYGEVTGEDVRDFDTLLFYGEDERQAAIQCIERLGKFIQMVIPPAAFETQCIDAFNVLWNIINREV